MGRRRARNFCTYCRVEFDADDQDPCPDATAASSCSWNRKSKATLQVVGEGFERIEDNPARLRGMQDLIRDGMAWRPDFDADGHIGRQANDLIARKLCKPPRSYDATRARHMFNVAERFGLHHVRKETA